jgi:hypothetical protein
MVALGHGAHVVPAEKPNLPQPLRQVWRWFNHLNVLREYSRLTEPVQMPDGRLGWQVKSRSLHISPERIESWARMARLDIEPWQFAGLTLIDEFYVRIKNDPPPPAVAGTAGGLLGMFRALGMKAKRS